MCLELAGEMVFTRIHTNNYGHGDDSDDFVSNETQRVHTTCRRAFEEIERMQFRFQFKFFEMLITFTHFYPKIVCGKLGVTTENKTEHSRC